jgi:hypothetical protein
VLSGVEIQWVFLSFVCSVSGRTTQVLYVVESGAFLYSLQCTTSRSSQAMSFMCLHYTCVFQQRITQLLVIFLFHIIITSFNGFYLRTLDHRNNGHNQQNAH